MNEHVERLINALSDPSIYPHRPGSVQVIQTHISIVFVAGLYVYKVKKPLSMGFLDYTTPEKRKFFCHQEVSLNSRFSENIYLGVAPIYESSAGKINLTEEGSEIESAVLMRYIPEEKVLRNALGLGMVNENIIDRVSKTIKDFHLKAASGPQISIFGAPEVITKNVKENFYQTEDFIGQTISAETFESTRSAALKFLEENRGYLEQRVKEGHIRDCHGDLHLDHVILFDKIMLVDCIEFNDRFRYSDCLADIAFLLMDLDFSGYPSFSRRVLSGYMRDERQKTAHDLLLFYKSYRAYVRGKVQSFASHEAEIEARVRLKSASTASSYFRLARAYFQPRPNPTLVIMCGLMGSGKSFLASRLAERLGIKAIRSDVTRKQMMGISPIEHRLDNYGEGIYTRESSDRIYRLMLERANVELEKNETVILDASFIKRSDRMAAGDLASNHNAGFLLIHCETTDDVIRSRLIRRIEETDEPSDGRWELYHRQKTEFEEIGPEEGAIARYDPSLDMNEFLAPITRQVEFGC